MGCLGSFNYMREVKDQQVQRHVLLLTVNSSFENKYLANFIFKRSCHT